MFYAMGHFSKFLPPDSVRVALTTSSSASSTLSSVDSVAFLTPDNQVVLILSNRDSAAHNITLSLSSQQLSTSLTLEALSIKTIVVGEIEGNNSSSSSSSASSATEMPIITTATPVSSTGSSSSTTASSASETPEPTTPDHSSC
ncbi:hypothetical protein PF005_g6480 [Phytophthora fragariae]|nr:hypothetical protein PF005_g6480 [Phytophthora fragariae]